MPSAGPWGEIRNSMKYAYEDLSPDQFERLVNSHADWKPFLAHLLGFDGELVGRHYASEERLANLRQTEQTIQTELGGTVVDASKIEGILLLKQKEATSKQVLLDAFDFRAEDKAETRALVEDVDQSIARLNGRRYTLQANRKKIELSLKEDQILFDPEEAQELFAQAGVLFAGQIKKLRATPHLQSRDHGRAAGLSGGGTCGN